jgi:toxin ParE1/3/4
MSTSNTTKSVFIRPSADADMREHIQYFYTNSSINSCDKLLDAFEKTFALIGEQPGIGSTRYAYLLHIEDLRMWPVAGFNKYLVFYLERPDYIDVLRILHGSRDIPAILVDE